jgi:Tol biopolymer transport system component
MAESAVKLSMRSRRVAACGVAVGICCASGAASPGSSVQLKPKTLAVVPGFVSAFSQDGPRLAWIRSGARCGGRVWLRDLRARRSMSLEQRGGPSCAGDPVEAGAIAVGGSRVVWVVSVGRGNTQYVASIVTAAATDQRNRRVARHDVAETGGGPDARVAADGSALVFWAAAGRESSVRRIVGRTPKRLFAVDLAADRARSDVGMPPLHPLPRGLAVAGGRVAVLENITPSCPCNLSPQWSPDSKRIAWSRAGTIYVMNADGSDERRVSPAGGAALTVQPWSPDGTRLTYGYRRSDRAPSEVYVVGANGRGRRRLTMGEQPMWSPAEQSLSFVRSGNVWTIEPDGTGARRLTSDGRGAQGGAEWAPDGSRLAAVRSDGLYVISAGAGGQRRISRGRHGGPARWSRAGDRIAFTDGGRIVVVNPNGSGRRRLGPGNNPVWSSDGTRLAFDWEARAAVPRVWVASSAGGPARAVTTRVLLAGPAWSPDGRAIVAGDVSEEHYLPRDPTAGIYRVAADGSALKRLAPDGHSAVDVRDARTGARIAFFTVAGYADSEALVALSRSYVVLRVEADRLHVHRPTTGALVASTRVPRNVGGIAVSDSGIVVFHVGRQIRAFDMQKRTTRLIGTAAAKPLGLSIDGRRLAWVENRRNRATIRAVTLPPRLR